MKKCSTSHDIREMRIKATISHHYTPVRMPQIWNTDNTNCWLEYRTTETLIYCGWECKMLQPFGKVQLFLTMHPSNCSLCYLSKGAENLCLCKNLHIDDYSDFIHNYQNLDYPSVGQWISKLSYTRQWNIIQHKDEMSYQAIKR